MNFKNFFVIVGTLMVSLGFVETASAGGGHGHGRGGGGHRGYYNAPPVIVYNAPHDGGYGRGYGRGYGHGRGHGRGHGWGHRRQYNPAPVVIYNQGYDRGYENYGYPQRPYYDSGIGFNINLGGRL